MIIHVIKSKIKVLPRINSYMFISINSHIRTRVPDFLSLKTKREKKFKYCVPFKHNWVNHSILRLLKKIENYIISIQKGNSYCRCKSSTRGPRFKVSSKGLSAEIDIPLQLPIQVQTKADVA